MYVLHQTAGTGGNSNSGNGTGTGGKTPPSPGNSGSGSSSGKHTPSTGNSGGSKTTNNGNSGNTKTVKPQLSKSEYQKNIDKANQYYNAKRWSTAKAYYKRALDLKPNDNFSKNRINQINQKLTTKTVTSPIKPESKLPVKKPTTTPSKKPGTTIIKGIR